MNIEILTEINILNNSKMVKRKRNLTRSCKNNQLHTQRVNECVEMQIKTTQPEEMILQQEINVKIAEENC